MEIRIAGTVNDSIVDGPGIRYTVFFQGCKHNCYGCHNPQTHNMNAGYLIDTDEIIKAIKENPLLDGITLSGGEPLLQVEGAATLAKACKENGLNVICYTGFIYEDVYKIKNIDLLLPYIDYLIDGKFDINQRDLSLLYRGSKNQRIIDVQKSLRKKLIVLKEF